MAKKNGKKAEHKHKERKTEAPAMDPRAKKELAAIFMALIALVSFLAFFKIAGPAGTFIDSALSAAFGLNKYLVPFILLALAGRIAFPERFVMRTPTTLGVFLFLVSLGALMNAVRWRTADSMLYLDHLSVAGGYLGLLLGYPLMALTGLWASLVILTGVLAISLVLTFNV